MNLENIENHLESLVSEEINRLVEEQDRDLDQTELEDIACLALNALPTRYVRSTVDLLSHTSDPDTDKQLAKVRRAVQKAFKTSGRRQAIRAPD